MPVGGGPQVLPKRHLKLSTVPRGLLQKTVRNRSIPAFKIAVELGVARPAMFLKGDVSMHSAMGALSHQGFPARVIIFTPDSQAENAQLAKSTATRKSSK